MILHLLSVGEWTTAQERGVIAPASLANEGFIHCTGDEATMLQVANRFYLGALDGMLVVDLDDMAISAPVVWEAPAHPDGSPAGDDEPRFPHVYGPVEVAAVRRVRALVLGDDKTFVGYVVACPGED